MVKDSAPGGSSRPALKAKAPAAQPANGRGAKSTRARASGGAATDRLRRVKTPSISTFFQESRGELSKVTWPTRQETLNLTGAVVAMTVGIAAFLGIVDEVLTLIVKPILGGQ